MIQIRSRDNDSVLVEVPPTVITHIDLAYKVLEKANLNGLDLRFADLSDTILNGADLGKAKLFAADFSGGVALIGANLEGADLRYANLQNADLSRANLNYATLDGANLCNAILHDANLEGVATKNTQFTDALLSGVQLEWSSHALISEILLQEACGDCIKMEFASLIRTMTSWCWDTFLEHPPYPITDWAITVLSKRIKEGDFVPMELLDALEDLEDRNMKERKEGKAYEDNPSPHIN